jgi:hypothetical protein
MQAAILANGPAARRLAIQCPIQAEAIDQGSGALKLLNKYPTGKGTNWVEIVSFD